MIELDDTVNEDGASVNETGDSVNSNPEAAEPVDPAEGGTTESDEDDQEDAGHTDGELARAPTSSARIYQERTGMEVDRPITDDERGELTEELGEAQSLRNARALNHESLKAQTAAAKKSLEAAEERVFNLVDDLVGGTRREYQDVIRTYDYDARLVIVTSAEPNLADRIEHFRRPMNSSELENPKLPMGGDEIEAAEDREPGADDDIGELVECETCKGTGLASEQDDDACEVCGGEGEVWIRTDAAADDDGPPVAEPLFPPHQPPSGKGGPAEDSEQDPSESGSVVSASGASEIGGNDSENVAPTVAVGR